MASNKSISDAQTRMGQWLSTEAINRLPNVRRSFDLSRDEYVRAQMLNKSVKQQGSRGGNGERGSSMVKSDKPKPAPAPKGEMRRSADRSVFSDRWLAEQRKAVMGRATARQDNASPSQAPSMTGARNLNSPSR